MVLSDRDLLHEGAMLLEPFCPEQVQQAMYLLTSDSFLHADSVTLSVGESTYVTCKETIHLNDHMTAIVHLTKQGIEAGLHLEAPVYLPGQHTKVIFRITNLSSETIVLHKGDCFASLLFLKTNQEVMTTYNNENTDFSFQKIHSYQRKDFTNYAGLCVMLGCVLSVVLVNIWLVNSGNTLKTMLTFDLLTASLSGFLIGILTPIVTDKKTHWVLWLVIGIAIAIVVTLQFVM